MASCWMPWKPWANALDQGEHKLTAEIVGANEKAIKAYMFGLDQIMLKAAD